MKTENKNNLLNLPPRDWIYITIYLLTTVAFLGFYYGFTQGSCTALGWLQLAWNPQTDYEHGWMVPLLSGWMLVHACRTLKEEDIKPSLHGIWLTILGGFLCAVSARTQQPRLAIGAIPFLLSGLVWYYWGFRHALKTAFPLFFLWIAIPLPGFQQATVGMQQLSAQLAHWGAGVCGVNTTLEGTTVTSASGNWDSFSIAGGCSGMRSLMALFMCSIAWGYLADKLSMWKRIVLALSALPLSIIANAFRVASIFICAEYINPAFAGKTWHDWSGLLFFFPASLVCLTLLHGLLAGELPLLKKRKVITRRSTSNENTPQKGEPQA